MTAQIPIVFIGTAPDFSGLTQLKVNDTLIGVINTSDFGNDGIMASDGAGTPAAIALAANTVLGNSGSGVQAVTFVDLAVALSVPTEINDIVTVAGLLEGDVLRWSVVDSDWKNQPLLEPISASVVLATTLIGLQIYWTSPVDWTITGWHIVGNKTGTAVIDIYKSNQAIPTVANRITGTERPTLAGNQLASDTNLTTWTTDVSIGDILGFNVDAASIVDSVTLTLTGTRNP